MYLYATDYDGTVTPHGVTPELLDALAKWKAQGNLFGVVTGRPYKSIREQLTKDGLPVDFLIANNGSIIADGNDNMLSVTSFAPETVQKLTTWFAREEHPSFRIDAVRFYVGWEYIPEIQLKDGLPSVGDTVWPEVTEITAEYFHPEDCPGAAEKIKEAFGDTVRPLLPGGRLIDCIPASCSKSIAVRRLTDLYHVKPEKIFTTGDSFNDLDMLICPDFEGYAVENAIEPLRKAVGRTIFSPLTLLKNAMNNK
ncbi:MAG: Cof-type HAD-IIB family hydrolase [Clostridia bacterium]|nr:Cof-type HAD-IIB family hydrolase [Clostridia bacterium]